MKHSWRRQEKESETHDDKKYFNGAFERFIIGLENVFKKEEVKRNVFQKSLTQNFCVFFLQRNFLPPASFNQNFVAMSLKSLSAQTFTSARVIYTQ